MPDYKILTFLDNHFAATQTLKAWYDGNLATMSPDDIDKYILDSYLMQLYNDQNKVDDIKLEWIKNEVKNEYSDIEHGSSDWSQRGEQYKILDKNKGIVLAENNYLPVDKRGNVNVLVVGRIRFW